MGARRGGSLKPVSSPDTRTSGHVGVVAVVGVAVAARAVLVLVVLRRRRAQLLRRLRPAPIRPLSRHDSNGLVRMRMQIAGTDNHYVAVRSMIVLHEASTHTS